MLAMLYANGQGVPRDYGVARRAACDAAGAPGKQCYPRVSASTWLAVLTEQRNRQLAGR